VSEPLVKLIIMISLIKPHAHQSNQTKSA